MRQFSEQEKDYIVQDYLINYNIQKLAKIFNVSDHRIKTVLKNRNIKIISDIAELWKKRFPRQSDIFEIIDTKEKAYWLGFLYADGCVLKDTKTIRINLSTQDEAHLVKFKHFIKAKNTEIKRNDKVDKTTNKTYQLSYFAISDEKMMLDLINKGCVPNKTYNLKFPDEEILPEHLQFHFIRGFIDGDGSIYLDEKRNRLCLNITGSKDMLNSIKNIFQNPNLKIEDKGAFGVLHFDGNKQVINILTKIYENSSEEIILPRKKEKFDNFLKTR